MAIKVRKGTKLDPNKDGYYTMTGDTPEDVQKLKGSLIAQQIKKQGKASIDKQQEAQRHGEEVMYPNGLKLRLPTDVPFSGATSQAEDAITYMRRNLVKGPPSVRTHYQMGARISRGRVVRDREAG